MIGALIRDLRLAHGWSQGRLVGALEAASGVRLGREYVSRWEHGKRRPGQFWLRHLAIVLQVPLTVLEEGGRVDRRTFLTDATAGAIAPAVASDLIGHGFSAALRARPSAEIWQGKLAAYGRDYMTAGAAEVHRRLTVDLVVLQQQLDSPVMWDVASRLMVLYGKTFPGSDGAKAAHWYRMAAEAADRSGDLPTRVWVRGRVAIALGYEGAALPVAQMFADQALALDPAPSLGRLNAIMGKAHAAALSGDGQGARELLARGRRVFDAAGSGDGEESDYAVPWWRMNIFSLERSRVLYEQDRRFEVVLEEAVLRYQVGNAEVMAGQLGHLLSVTSMPWVSVGVIPFTVRERPMWTLEGFLIFDDVRVDVELLSARVTVTQPREVAIYDRAFAAQSAMAVHGQEARALIASAITALG